MNGHKPHSLENINILDKTAEEIILYTCSAPKERILKRYGIRPIGDQFGCADPREVLRIPLKIFKRGGYDFSDSLSRIINTERFLEIISR